MMKFLNSIDRFVHRVLEAMCSIFLAAMVVIVGFLIGSVTPPVGVAYFTSATIAQVRLEKVAVALIPYLVGLFLLLFFILVVPELTMFLPNLLSN